MPKYQEVKKIQEQFYKTKTYILDLHILLS